MYRRTCLLQGYGEVLYPATSALPSNFYQCCSEHFGIVLHAPTFMGVRASQQRGLFLAQKQPLESNQPIATIPLASVYTTENISTKPNVMAHVTVEDVRNAIVDEECKLMAPLLYLGLQFASIIDALPNVTRMDSKDDAAMRRAFSILRQGPNPWARVLDDEDFNEDHVYGMYGMTLDSWQKASFEEMTAMFHRATSSIHGTFQPPFKVRHFRRIARLVLARAEHIMPAGYYDRPRWQRSLSRRWRQFSRQPARHVPAMVPLLDLVNHSNRPNCGVRLGPSSVLGGKPAITMVSLGRIEPGHEICRHYNFAISRASALFRYGFLPFDLIAVVEHDSVHETFVRNPPSMRSKSEVVLSREAEMAADVARMETIYQKARRATSS